MLVLTGYSCSGEQLAVPSIYRQNIGLHLGTSCASRRGLVGFRQRASQAPSLSLSLDDLNGFPSLPEQKFWPTDTIGFLFVFVCFYLSLSLPCARLHLVYCGRVEWVTASEMYNIVCFIMHIYCVVVCVLLSFSVIAPLTCTTAFLMATASNMI